MVRVDKSKTVNAPLEKIYAIIADFEKLPSRFPNRYRSLKVIERSGNSVTVDEDNTVAGREIHQITKHLPEPSRMLGSEVIDGDTKGTVVQIMLEQDGTDKTKVSVDAKLKLGKLGSMMGIFAKGRINDAFEKMMDEFENAVNSQTM